MNTKKSASRYYIPVLLLFIFTNTFFVTAQGWLAKWNIDQTVVIFGNIILGLVTLLSLYLTKKALQHSNTSGFLRNTYGSFIIKLFVCAGATILYAVTAGKNLNRNGVFVCIFLYFLYIVLEKYSLLRWNKQERNG
jgi:Ca2+/Na+ antiporter